MFFSNCLSWLKEKYHAIRQVRPRPLSLYAAGPEAEEEETQGDLGQGPAPTPQDAPQLFLPVEGLALPWPAPERDPHKWLVTTFWFEWHRAWARGDYCRMLLTLNKAEGRLHALLFDPDGKNSETGK